MSNRFQRKLHFSIIVGTVALIATACGAGGSAPAADQSQVQTTSAPATDQNQDQTTSTPATDQSQGQAQGSDAAEFGLTEAEVVRRVDAVELLIAKCMVAAGFEYLPINYSTTRKAMDTNSKPSGMTADEFRTQFGYGITTLSVTANSQANIGLGLNFAIRAGLGVADQVAWNRQLLGENTDQTFAVGLDSEDLSRTGGCTRAAVETTFTQAELGPSFVNYQNTQGGRVDQDPRIIDAYRNWASCMRKAGHNYDNSAAIKVELATRLNTVTGGASLESLLGDAAAALSQLQGEERAISTADHKCDLKHVADVKKKVETELLGASSN